MVKRNTPSAGGKTKRTPSSRQQRRGSRAADEDEMYQQPGKLMLNNPLIPPEMDEDIDDDLAFNSDDERMFGHLFQKKEDPSSSKAKKRKSTTKKSRSRAAEDDDDEDDGYGDALEAVGKAHGKSSKGSRRPKKGAAADDDDDDLFNYHEDGQTSDDDDDYIDLSDMLDQSIAAEKTRAVKTQKKRKVATIQAEDGQQVAKKRRAAKLNDDEENLFGSAVVNDGPSAKSFGSTLRQLVDSGEAQSAEEEKARLRIKQAMNNKHNLLSTDMDDITKNRLTRREVREVVKGDMKKYAPLLREMSTAKHLQFPMQAPDSNPTPSTIGGIVAASRKRFKAADAAGAEVDSASSGAHAPGSAGSLATRMNALLATAGLSGPRDRAAGGSTDGGIGSFVAFDEQDGDTAGYAPQEGLGERPTTNYMAKLKAMLSYENSRRKRLNRIKSKTYRRILRKEKDREDERRQAAFELLHPELARKRLADRLAKARAEERVTQKHKNTSAWVKRAKRFANVDENAKDAVNEQLSVHQRLMAKMDQEAGEDMTERYDAEPDDAGSEEEEERLVDELLAQMNQESEGGAPVDVASLTRKLWGLDGPAGGGRTPQTPTERARAELREMKFMKAARERTEKGMQERTESLLESIRRARSGEEMLAEDDDEDMGPSSTPRNEGGEELPGESGAALRSRKRFTAQKSTSQRRAVEAVELKPRTGLRADAADAAQPADNAAWSDDAEENDSAGDGTAGGTLGRFAGDRKDARRATRSTRITVRYEGHPKRARDDQPDGSDPTLEEPALSDTFDGNDETHSETAEDDLRAQQQYLISRAFANDDVDADFLKEKEAQVEMIMKPEDKNQNLPGWGEWGGEDPALNRRHQEKLAHVAAQKKIEKTFLVKSRADAALEHVIINHDGVELVPDRMTLHMVPRPFSNPTEFARSMRQPLGPEWSSALSFKERAQPRVEVRQGHTVAPLDLSLRKKTTKTKRRKTEKSKSS